MAKHKSVKTVSCFLLLSSNFGPTAGLHLKNVVHNFYEILDVTRSPMDDYIALQDPLREYWNKRKLLEFWYCVILKHDVGAIKQYVQFL